MTDTRYMTGEPIPHAYCAYCKRITRQMRVRWYDRDDLGMNCDRCGKGD